MMDDQFAKYCVEPVDFSYIQVSKKEVNFLKEFSRFVLIKGTNRFLIQNSYYKDSLKGSLGEVFVRESMYLKLMTALSELGEDYKFIIYDGFRTIECQREVFQLFYQFFKNKNPNKDHDALYEMTRIFASDPDECETAKKVLSHNSGGAIDLSISYKDEVLDMGTDFDAPTEMSYSDFFESPFDEQYGMSEDRWLMVRNNRRFLINVMKNIGLSNYEKEWWHFDLGNRNWAERKHGKELYLSGEKDIYKHIKEYGIKHFISDF